MHVVENKVILSASDVVQAGTCEFAFLRVCDAKLGRDVVIPENHDSMLERTSELGDEHEAKQLEEYRRRFPGEVLEIARPEHYDETGLRQRAEETRAAFEQNHRIVFQATFFDPTLHTLSTPGAPSLAFAGFADFIERVKSEDGTVAWQVQDTKLARTARVSALIQVAAYAEQLEKLGLKAHENIVLLLGDGSRSTHHLTDIAPVFRSRRDRTIELILDSWHRTNDAITPWDSEGVFTCGRCEVCEAEVARSRDLLLVAGLSITQRTRLKRSGVHTIDELANIAESCQYPDVSGITPGVLHRHATQALLQVKSENREIPEVMLRDAKPLERLPEPSDGDLFFDFEGDPLYQEQAPGHSPQWGLDYLFGMVDTSETYTALWAHNLLEEREALQRFLEIVQERKQQHPDMHIYHYAPYEKTHLLSIAARHGVGEAEVDNLLREGTLIDLYPVVRQALAVGSKSYSIKKLEPLYMGEEYRDESGVTDGAESVAAYVAAAAKLHSPDPTERQEAQSGLEALADYNRYDCVSTLRLRDWLRSLAAEHGITPFPRGEEPAENPDVPEFEQSQTGAELLEWAQRAEHPVQAQALRMAASAIDYHQREQKSFWWEHFARVELPVEEWADTRDVLVVNPLHSRVLEDWCIPPRARKLQRLLELRGQLAPGSHVSSGSGMYALYDSPVPFPQPPKRVGKRDTVEVNVEEVHGDTVTVRERLPQDAEPFDELPLALTPGRPPNTNSLKEAITEWGEGLVQALTTGSGINDPVFDLLQRTPPRLRGGTAPTAVKDQDIVGAVTDSLVKLEHSYLAVQGPPGTGKTYLASHVMKRLVQEHGWRIGVVAQSHKVVENVLDGVVNAGLDPDFVAKAPQNKQSFAHSPPAWKLLDKKGYADFLLAHETSGAVVGGTAWDFSNASRVERGMLDLLVIDEAGQYSLAPTIASAVAAQRLLLLGDPQQLPQVSQGTHPEPVDESALGWLIAGQDTLPTQFGYFLAETRRMHPALADIDSRLSYAGKLRAHPSTTEREFVGAGDPGLVWHPVHHRGNTTFSSEEAQRVVEVVQELLMPTQGSAITVDDIIIVAAYNAQVECVERALTAAGIRGVRVGTVDKFQGQEAVVAIVTLAASSPEEVPRGLDFLLMRNRLNVAISRAQWVTHLISSPDLGGVGLPRSIAETHALSGYLLLTELGRKS